MQETRHQLCVLDIKYHYVTIFKPYHIFQPPLATIRDLWLLWTAGAGNFRKVFWQAPSPCLFQTEVVGKIMWRESWRSSRSHFFPSWVRLLHDHQAIQWPRSHFFEEVEEAWKKLSESQHQKWSKVMDALYFLFLLYRRVIIINHTIIIHNFITLPYSTLFISRL